MASVRFADLQSRPTEFLDFTSWSCTRRLRIIISSRKPGKMPPSHHA
jgi:hypothetical protein